MSDSLVVLRHRIGSAQELQTVVRAMKAIAAANIGRYEQAVRALDAYNETVWQGLAVALRQERLDTRNDPATIGLVVFGSDQGLVGQFNDDVAAFAVQSLAGSMQSEIWAVGERLAWRLSESRLSPTALLAVPNTLSAITGLIGQLLGQMEIWLAAHPYSLLLVVHQRPQKGGVPEPVAQRLLPLDEIWRRTLLAEPWPGQRLPEVFGDRLLTLPALIREYLFVSLYRACAESLASENASRLAAMQRAGKNIDEMLNEFKHDYNRVRQEHIDEELFDVVAGFEAQSFDQNIS